VDRKSLHVRLSDEAYPIGPAPSRESYLSIDKLMDVARRAGCDAVHPGYGFLAENAALPRACTDRGLTFIGPPADAMEALGSKTAGRQLARRADVPTVPGINDPIEIPAEAQALAQRMGYPVLLKAVAGGGGKGMRLVNNDAEFDSAFPRRFFRSHERFRRRPPIPRKSGFPHDEAGQDIFRGIGGRRRKRSWLRKKRRGMQNRIRRRY